MSNLTYLNDASVLHNLRQRYYAKLIYVSIAESSKPLALMQKYYSMHENKITLLLVRKANQEKIITNYSIHKPPIHQLID